ncbi:NUDIX hydrolase [Peribacillus simplex]|uniref:NUDIX hydrolase n=1 Tax=Peribacillus simplex TaxID=1478 RepID=UPI003335C12E
MDKVFGEKIGGLDYQIKKGVYAIIFNSAKDKVLAVQNSRGHHFLPGGGIENEESYQECLEREMLEETGYPFWSSRAIYDKEEQVLTFSKVFIIYCNILYIPINKCNFILAFLYLITKSTYSKILCS